jgi:hypothetical protein
MRPNNSAADRCLIGTFEYACVLEGGMGVAAPLLVLEVGVGLALQVLRRPPTGVHEEAGGHVR